MPEDFCFTQKLLDSLYKKGFVCSTFLNLKDKVRNKIMKALFSQSAEKGPANINIKLVAQEAGVSIGSMYQYFENRDKLFLASIELVTETMISTIDRYKPVLMALPFGTALTEYLKGGFAMEKKQRGAYLFFLSAVYKDDGSLLESVVRPVSDFLFRFTEELVMKGISRKQLRADIPADHLVSIVHAFILATADSLYSDNLKEYFRFAETEKEYLRKLKSFLKLIEA